MTRTMIMFLWKNKRIISESTIKKLASKDEVLHPNQVVIDVSNGNGMSLRKSIFS